MTPKERKQYRLELLKEIYDYNFSNKNEPYEISVSKDEENGEKYLAIRYLEANEYVTSQPPHSMTEFNLRVAYKGIDLIENL